MQIIGPEPTPVTDDAVHTIDVWYSDSQRYWVVQRLNAHGDGIGHSHKCRTRAEATACVADWMRRHPETHLATPFPERSGERGRRSGHARASVV